MTSHGSKFRKVLVIDDNETDRYIASRNLRKYNVADEIITIGSAREGLDYLLSMADTPDQLPNVIFLDIRMPEIDGFGFLEEYSNLPDAVKTTCIVMMLSTSLNPGDHERAAKSKYVNRFMNKPLDKEKLETLNEDIVEKSNE